MRGSVGGSFVQLAGATASDAVATLRLVEPGSRALNEAMALRNSVSDALGALEDRQQADDTMYASLAASTGALDRASLPATN